MDDTDAISKAWLAQQALDGVAGRMAPPRAPRM